MKERWQLNRAGLFNFWYYDDEEYHFADGKLLLRGSNGSGKSVTMQSLITVLLDGKKSPDRLDPFGSKARRMEDYLLGEREVLDLEERTGYLFLEYVRPGSGQYFTSGLGLRAKRHSPLDSWGFVIWDNRRIGRDFLLYKTESDPEGGQQKIPLTRRELENRLDPGGKVVKSQKDYMELVNKYLFGFERPEAFEELVKLLIQLRSPKLSKDFKPTVIYEILNESLPALSDEELRPLSDTIETMDQIKSQLDQLIREEQSLARLCRHYDSYNQRVYTEKADGLLRTHNRREQVRRKTSELEQELAGTRENINRLQNGLQALKREQEVLSGEEEQLRQHSVFGAERDKSDLTTTLNGLRGNQAAKERVLNEKQAGERKGKQALETEEGRLSRHLQEIEERLDEMSTLAEEASFLNNDVAAEEFRQRRDDSFSFALWRQEAKHYEEQLAGVLKAFRQEAQAKERHQDAERELGEARQAWDEAQAVEKKWADSLEEARRQWLADLFAWHKTNQELRLDERELRTIAQILPLCPEQTSWEGLKEPATAARDRLRQGIQAEVLQVEHEIRQQDALINETQTELNQWRQHREPEPVRHPATEQARQALQAQGVPFAPFYAAVEFQDFVEPDLRERLEAAMIQAGMLDALIIAEGSVAGPGEGKVPPAPVLPANDRILRARPQILAHTLADYLYAVPTGGIPAAQIDNVLRSILVGDEDGLEEGQTAISGNGNYRIGILAGHAPAGEAAIYIGKESRRQYRLREIARLEAVLAGLKQALAAMQERRELLDQKLARLAEEYRQFPADQPMKQAFNEWDGAKRQVQWREQEVAKKDHKFRQTMEAWQQTKAVLRELARPVSLDLSQPVYEDALHRMTKYREELGALELAHQKAMAARGQQVLLKQNLADTMAAVDELKGELATLHDQIQLTQEKLVKVEERLRELGAEEIRCKIEAVVSRLKVLPGEIETLVGQIASFNEAQKQRQAAIDRQGLELRQADDLLEQWLHVFAAEEHLQKGFLAPAAEPVDS